MIGIIMKRKILFFAGLVGVVLVIIGSVKLLGDRSPKQGELRVESNPAASVFLDNKHFGRTPLKKKVDIGEYTLKIVPESTTPQLASWQGKIVVGLNLLTYVNSNLTESELSNAVDVLWLEKITSKKSEVTLTTNPDGATVAIDEETKGMTPLSIGDITPADHTITITSPGFVMRQLKVKTTAGYRLIATIKLALAPSAQIPEASLSATPTISGKPTPTEKLKPTPTKTATPSATIPDPQKPFVIIKDTPTGFLRVREEPSTAATEAARVNPGEKYTILDTQNGWYQIKYNVTDTGWISGQYAEKVE